MSHAYSFNIIDNPVPTYIEKTVPNANEMIKNNHAFIQQRRGLNPSDWITFEALLTFWEYFMEFGSMAYFLASSGGKDCRWADHDFYTILKDLLLLKLSPHIMENLIMFLKNN